MKLSYPFATYIKSIKPEICEKIINLGLSKISDEKKGGLSTQGTTYGNKQKINENKKNKSISDSTIEEIGGEKKNLDKYYFRDSEVCGLSDKWLYDTFLPLIGDANKKAGWNWIIDTAEMFQFAIYHGKEEDGGFYGWHIDGSSDFNSALKPAIRVNDKPLRFKPPKKNSDGLILKDKKNQPMPDMNAEDLPLKEDQSGLPPKYSEDIRKWNKVRKISMTVNLSNPFDYEGGNLKFDLGPHVKERYKICNEIRPQGSVIVFPSFMYHCVTPVTSGTRYSLVLWCMGKPWQ